MTEKFNTGTIAFKIGEVAGTIMKNQSDPNHPAIKDPYHEIYLMMLLEMSKFIPTEEYEGDEAIKLANQFNALMERLEELQEEMGTFIYKKEGK
jgi:hypothetical protein